MAKGKEAMEEKNTQEKKEAKEETIMQDAAKESAVNEDFDEKDKRISDLELQNAELIDLLKRKQAEFENYRNRVEKDQCEFAKHAADKIICDLLEVLDNFSLSLKHGVDKQGVKMIYEQFLSKLQKLGVIEYSMLGKKFDPNFCEALCVCSDPQKEDKEVIEEIAKGYMSHDKVLRCAKVIINKKEQENINTGKENIGKEKNLQNE